MNESNRYKDIIHLEHHQSEKHPHMSNYDRAAQFSPFAALKGYEDEIEETSRYTDARRELDETTVFGLNETLLLLKGKKSPKISVTYFEHDLRKAGGKYVTKRAALKRVAEHERKLLFEDGEQVHFDNISELTILDE